MPLQFSFIFSSMLLGVGLAMDAFSVSLANGLRHVHMKLPRLCLTAGVFSFFQFIMPLIGWFFVHTAAGYFVLFQKWIPTIALLLLCYIGGKMLLEGLKHAPKESAPSHVGPSALLVQGIATSIDALSVGFTIAEYNAFMALICSLIIAIVTFVLCALGVLIGKRFGMLLADKASIFGGLILICIGLKIFISSFL